MRYLLPILLLLAAIAKAEGGNDVPKPDGAVEMPVSELGEMPTVVAEPKVIELTLKNGQRYIVPDEPLTEAQRLIYGEMKAEDQAAFRKTRLEYLQLLLKVLDKGRMPAGMLSAGKDAFFASMGRLFRRSTGEEEPKPPKLTWSERGRNAIEYVLRLADAQLWEQAPMLARSNEVGFTFEIGAGGGLAVGKYGLYGTTAFALAVNLDRRNKFVSLEFYQDVERLERAIPFTAGVAVYAAVTGNVNHHDWSDPSAIEHGESISGPGPLVGTKTPKSLRLGVGRGIGIAPPFLGDIAMIQTKLTRIPWLRIGVSPNVPGFFRMKTAVVPAVKAVVGMAVQAPVQAFKLVKKGCELIWSYFRPPPERADARWYGF